MIEVNTIHTVVSEILLEAKITDTISLLGPTQIIIYNPVEIENEGFDYVLNLVLS
jgi:hypothetical protein